MRALFTALVAVALISAGGGLAQSIASTPSAAQTVAAMRATIGVPPVDTSGVSLTGCSFTAAQLAAGDVSVSVLIGALAPQTTRLGRCLAPSSNGYQSPDEDKLYVYPADGATGRPASTPVLVFATGPWVQSGGAGEIGANPFLGANTPKLTLVSARDGRSVGNAGVSGYTPSDRPAVVFQIDRLVLGTRYRAHVTLTTICADCTPPYASETTSWSFTTAATTPVPPGTNVPKVALSRPTPGTLLSHTPVRCETNFTQAELTCPRYRLKGGVPVTWSYTVTDRSGRFGYGLGIYAGTSSSHWVAGTGAQGVYHQRLVRKKWTWATPRAGTYQVCIGASDIGKDVSKRGFGLACQLVQVVAAPRVAHPAKP